MINIILLDDLLAELNPIEIAFRTMKDPARNESENRLVDGCLERASLNICLRRLR